jgi:hypothetical protein
MTIRPSEWAENMASTINGFPSVGEIRDVWMDGMMEGVRGRDPVLDVDEVEVVCGTFRRRDGGGSATRELFDLLGKPNVFDCLLWIHQ